jgi:hypothetical protein
VAHGSPVCSAHELGDFRKRMRIPKLALDVFPDHARSYSAGNIRRFGGSTSSQIMLKNPEVGTEWALKHFPGARSRA